MSKKKNKKPVMYVTPSLGLFYLNIEFSDQEVEMLGPYKTLAEAEDEKARQTKLRKKK